MLTRRKLLAWFGSVWPFSIMANDNCYWIDEQECFELCAQDFLPPLTSGWVQFDTTRPDATGGRAYNDTSYPGGGPGYAKPAASSGENGVIIIGCNYRYGVTNATDGSHYSYGSHRSTDYGFTYDAFTDYTPWLAGSIAAGYDADYDGWGVWYHHGTKISYDGVSKFYVVNTTHLNISNTDIRFRTHVSTDNGETWSTNTVVPTNPKGVHVTQSDSYNGNVWCFGTNYYGYNLAAQPQRFIAAHSDDDGATWSETVVGTDIDNYSTTPYDEWGDVSANADGLHILQEIFFGSFPGPYTYGLYYWRPTSNATWAAPVMLFDYENSSNYSDWGDNILGSRVTSGLVLATTSGYAGSFSCIYVRRSIDSGQSFAAEYSVNFPTVNYYIQPFDARNAFDLVELADGRIVLVGVVRNDANQPEMIYSVSEDLGVSFSSWTALGSGTSFWIKDDKFQGQRVWACARGVDVVVTQTDRTQQGNVFIFRP